MRPRHYVDWRQWGRGDKLLTIPSGWRSSCGRCALARAGFLLECGHAYLLCSSYSRSRSSSAFRACKRASCRTGGCPPRRCSGQPRKGKPSRLRCACKGGSGSGSWQGSASAGSATGQGADGRKVSRSASPCSIGESAVKDAAPAADDDYLPPWMRGAAAANRDATPAASTPAPAAPRKSQQQRSNLARSGAGAKRDGTLTQATGATPTGLSCSVLAAARTAMAANINVNRIRLSG